MERAKWNKRIYVISILAVIIGTLDPLEGSVLIAVGCAGITASNYLTHDKHWKIFLATLIMIVFGVFFLFYFSSLGGFGGASTLSWWWATLVIPYPAGWLILIILLVIKAVAKTVQKSE